MLRGLVVPVPTLFGEEGEFDAGRNGPFVRGISAAGVDHVFVLSAVGEIASVEEAERRLLLESTIESLTGKSDAWVGVGAPSTRLAVRFAQSAEERGAGALVAVPPYFLHPTSEAVAHYYRALRDGSKIPLLAANLPAFAGYSLAPELVHRLARERVLDGVVDAAGFLTSVEGFLGGAPEGFAVFSGVDGLAADAIGRGAGGALLETANVVPRLAVALVRAALAHETARASELQGLVDRVAGAMRAGPFPSATKFLVSQVRGASSGFRAPYEALTAAEERAVMAEFDPLRGLLHAYL
ncbi:MAG: dihydrodipicolinate synthase family protein [Thermoplasmata archaeon]|nr:dihydrodipicolinate synthase family protein [Thermoplasmata archaeon]MCI4361688.1 dihydrodipicolinate synthase family protein [Thermoplasmata archaeon]